MQSDEIRRRFLAFFEKRGHVIIPSASLIPENDPSVLFTTAGMQPLAPYLLGQPHPAGKRLVNVQKCVRTQDIDEVGDKTHDTFFEMLGNWSLGDYFKKEAIMWSYEFLTSKDEGLGLDPGSLYITCFEGGADAPRDEESAAIWKSLGIPEDRIYFLGKESNWWSPGPNGPSGPDTEMFYDIGGNLNLSSKEEFLKADEEQKVVEIWNDVFMEYEKRDGKVIGKLSQKNVDTGAGLERLAMVMQGKDNIFETDLFQGMMTVAARLADDIKSQRIIADHFRTAVFMVGEGVAASNTDRGYVLRRLLRRAVLKTGNKKIDAAAISALVGAVIGKYASVYRALDTQAGVIIREIEREYELFEKTLTRGLQEFEKHTGDIDGPGAFSLFATYGFPIELTRELAAERGIAVDESGFTRELKKHQEISRAGAGQKFKGGLADESAETVRLHTATHLLHSALRRVLGNHVCQKGSNITAERLRFDFSHPGKMTLEEISRVEAIVNEAVERGYEMRREVLTVEEAKNRGAIGLFDDEYAKVGGKVSVYNVTDPKSGEVYSSEICGGPHISNTSEIGRFKIIKEEAVAAGIRRVKAALS